MSKNMLSNIMKQAQQMQERVKKLQEEAGGKTVEASSGGGMVTVVANGRQEVLSIKIDPSVVDPKDIEVHMEKGILSIKGERKSETKEENEKFTRVERSRGVFYRRFALPDSADAEGVTASGKHGVLEIVIPKRPETTPRRIAINH